MDKDGYRPLLAFYNQTFHGMTMAAGLRLVGSSFRIDSRLAGNMLENVEGVIESLRGSSKQQRFTNAWLQAKVWLDDSRRAPPNSNHSAAIYALNALAYATWTKLCDNPKAKHYAEEHYTVIAHPEKHPGAKAIESMWSAPTDSSETQTVPATLSNLVALIEREQDLPRPEIDPPSSQRPH